MQDWAADYDEEGQEQAVRDGRDSGVAMMAAAKMAAAEDSKGRQQQRLLAASMRAAAADDGRVDRSRRGEALNGGVGSNVSMMAAQQWQWRRLEGNKGGSSNTMRVVGETAADDGVDGGRREGGR